MTNNTFTKKFWGGFLLFTIVIGIICFFPKWFTQAGSLDFSDTGQIGGTIGGIMGPFVAIAAAALTFLAFWVQYKANEQLRADMTLERFESKFYKMLDIHIQNVTVIMDKYNFDFFIKNYQAIFSVVDEIVQNYLNNFSFYGYEIGRDELVDYMRTLSDNEKQRKNVVNLLAYGYFFYGSKYLVNRDSGNDSLLSAFQLKIHSEIIKRLVQMIPSVDGYNDKLGRYYRHMFHTISYIAKMDDVIVPEEQKYEYAKMLRGQMSDQEQLLLYYNSLSIPGRNWNEKNFGRETLHDREDMGYIARFRLIKNISNLSTIYGLNPKDKYAEEIGIWARRYECDFFEQEGS